MAALRIVFALLLCSFLHARTQALGVDQTEPQCLSRFDHDYKVLQKLVELEQNLKALEQRLATNTSHCSVEHCPDGWTRYHGSCYLFVNYITMTWSQGQQYCEGNSGAHLAVMETFAEQDFLMSRAKNMKVSGSSPFYWIGASDLAKEGQWVWYPSGSSVSSGGSVWHPGQPAKTISQNCGCLYRDTDYTFHDHICTLPGYIICEKSLKI